MCEKKPIYDAKVRKIIELLKFKTRDEAAEDLGYKTYKSLDMYMRRKNFRFDAEANQYVPQENKTHKLDRDPKSYAPTKVVSIITAFEEANSDPKLISKKRDLKTIRKWQNIWLIRVMSGMLIKTIM